jgi:hypothetical protein
MDTPVSVENDLVSWDDIRMTEARAKQEEASRKTRVAIAKIEAKRDVKVARASSDSYLTLRAFLGFLVAVVLFTGVIAGCEAATYDPEDGARDDQYDQKRMELCMAREGDWVWSDRDGCHRDD